MEEKATPGSVASLLSFPCHLPFFSSLCLRTHPFYPILSYHSPSTVDLFRAKSLNGRLGTDCLVSSGQVIREMDKPPPVPMNPSLSLSSVDLTYVDGCRSVRQPQPLELCPNPPKSTSRISS